MQSIEYIDLIASDLNINTFPWVRNHGVSHSSIYGYVVNYSKVFDCSKGKYLNPKFIGLYDTEEEAKKAFERARKMYGSVRFTTKKEKST